MASSPNNISVASSYSAQQVLHPFRIQQKKIRFDSQHEIPRAKLFPRFWIADKSGESVLLTATANTLHKATTKASQPASSGLLFTPLVLSVWQADVFLLSLLLLLHVASCFAANLDELLPGPSRGSGSDAGRKTRCLTSQHLKRRKREEGCFLQKLFFFSFLYGGDVLPDARFPQRICEDALQEDHCTNDEQVLLCCGKGFRRIHDSMGKHSGPERSDLAEQSCFLRLLLFGCIKL